MSFLDDFYGVYNPLVGDIHLTVAIIGLTPLILNFKYWRQLKIVDYLLVFLFFLFWSPYTIIEGEYLEKVYGTFIYNFWNVVDALPLFIVAVRAKWKTREEIPKWVYVIGGIPILLAIITVIDNQNTYFYFLKGSFHYGSIDPNADWSVENVTTTWFWSVWVSRILYHAFIVYFYYSTEHIITKRANVSRRLWIGSSLLWIWTMLSLMINSGFLGWDQSGNSALLLGFLLPFLFSSILILINHIFFPEAVLITYEQVHRASNLYKQVSLRNRLVYDIGISTIKSYIDSIPAEFMEDRSV